MFTEKRVFWGVVFPFFVCVYLNIFMGQIKNLMLKQRIFEEPIVQTLNKLDRNQIINNILDSFTFNRRTEEIKVIPDELPEFFQRKF